MSFHFTFQLRFKTTDYFIKNMENLFDLGFVRIYN